MGSESDDKSDRHRNSIKEEGQQSHSHNITPLGTDIISIFGHDSTECTHRHTQKGTRSVQIKRANHRGPPAPRRRRDGGGGTTTHCTLSFKWALDRRLLRLAAKHCVHRVRVRMTEPLEPRVRTQSESGHCFQSKGDGEDKGGGGERRRGITSVHRLEGLTREELDIFVSV